jgi:hypothetical protein
MLLLCCFREEMEGKTALWCIMNNVISGDRLAFPEPSTVEPPLPEATELVSLAKACWAQNPKERPTMAHVAKVLKGIIDEVKARRSRETAAPGGVGGQGRVRGTPALQHHQQHQPQQQEQQLQSG